MNYIKDLKLCQTNGKCSISISDHDDDGDSDNDDSCWLFCMYLDEFLDIPMLLCLFPKVPLEKGESFPLGHLEQLGSPHPTPPQRRETSSL